MSSSSGSSGSSGSLDAIEANGRVRRVFVRSGSSAGGEGESGEGEDGDGDSATGSTGHSEGTSEVRNRLALQLAG